MGSEFFQIRRAYEGGGFGPFDRSGAREHNWFFGMNVGSYPGVALSPLALVAD